MLGERPFMTTADPILAGLSRLQRTNRSLDLLNLHKGVPVVYPAQVQAVHDSTATFRITTFQIVCLTLESVTTLLSQLLEEAVSAKVLAVDLAAGLATLGQFQYASHHVGDRMTVRVAPREVVDVALECGGEAQVGRLADLSINGLGLHVPKSQAGAFRPRAVVHVRLPLPGAAPAILEISGTIRFVRPEADRLRVGITFAEDVRMMSILPYVRERQNEILAELEKLHSAQLAPS